MDPAFVVLGAAHAVRVDARSTPRWLNLAMARAPGWAAPHVLASSFLERRGRFDQAAMELSFVFERAPTEAWDPSCAMLKRHPTEALARALLPPYSPLYGAWISEHVAGCLLSTSSTHEAEAFLLTVVNRYPRSAFAHGQLVELALRRGDGKLAVERAWQMRRLLPSEPASAATIIRAMTRTGAADEALMVYDASSPAIRGSRGVLLEAMAAAAQTKRASVLQKLSLDLIETSSTASLRGEAQTQASLQFEALGALETAVAHAQLAYEQTGDPALLQRVHELALRAGISQVALRAAAELCHVRHQGDAYCAASRDP
jgi:hypothetical protein